MSCPESVTANSRNYFVSAKDTDRAFPTQTNPQLWNPVAAGFDIEAKIRQAPPSAYAPFQKIIYGPWECLVLKNPPIINPENLVSISCRIPKDFAASCFLDSNRPKSCDIGSGTPASYQECKVQTSPSSTCEMYKTPEALDEYIESNQKLIDSYKLIFPQSKADIFLSRGDEKSLYCLIAQYQSDDLYEEIILDLKSRFFDIFGVQFEDLKYDKDECKSSIDVTLNNFNPKLDDVECRGLTADSLNDMVKPADISETKFNRFLDDCRTLLSYESMQKYFKDTSEEIKLLLTDLPAQESADRSSGLNDLKSGIHQVKGSDFTTLSYEEKSAICLDAVHTKNFQGLVPAINGFENSRLMHSYVIPVDGKYTIEVIGTASQKPCGTIFIKPKGSRYAIGYPGSTPNSPNINWKKQDYPLRQGDIVEFYGSRAGCSDGHPVFDVDFTVQCDGLLD